MKAKRLNQLVAVEKSVKTQVSKALTDAYQQMQKPALLTGLSKTYRPKDEEGDKLPSENQKVQVRTDDLILEVRKNLADLFEIVASKDSTNCLAKADIVVDGKTLITDVPAIHLLWLEKQLTDLKTFIGKLPVLDPTETWHFDKNQNCFATEPAQTIRQKKVQEPLTLAPATDKHAAQVTMVTKDILDGYWTTVKFSGALPAQEVKVFFERVEKLQRAVKTAREEANLKETIPLNTAPVLDYLFDTTTFSR